ncbi:phenylalanine--tRNA ligase subunit beta [Gammaproteobacteria bacterium 42_54_T18]|nr:phenylalanine--tRNA ligase subunit beta [Gammaproteobacteria bacterium 42_54_T18]
MQFSEKWLREWVNPSISTEALVEQLTMAGLEVDGTEPVAGQFNNVVVAEIESIEQHPDADKLRVCQVNVGDDELVTIVCGAPNARQGLRIPCAKVGAVLPGDFKIKKAKLRGVPSFGMLCGASELGLEEKSPGLMELPSDAPIGTDIREYLDLDDISIDVDLTPNRGDCLGLVGLSREVGVLNRVDVTQVHIDEVVGTIEEVFPVDVTAKAQCPRYLCRVIKGINGKAETPLWMVERLRRSGVRSIDPVVDVTNYVLLEQGQPMHAFDLSTLDGGILVRMAKQGEKITLLGDQEITLNDDTLVIADSSKALAVAGVMGGLASSVTSATNDILLESAFFEPVAIAGKARGYGLHTDSSHRFERGVDFELQRKAIERATALLLDIVGGDVGPVVEALSPENLPHIEPIQLRRDQIERVLGFSMPDADVEDILGRLGMDIVTTDAGWHIVPPAYRFDVRIEVDLIEELGRIWGYNKLPIRLPAMGFSAQATPENEINIDTLKQRLVARDYQEAITYSFVDKDIHELMAPGEKAIELANPISADMSQMRLTLWAGLIKAAQHNINRQQTRLRLFESGLIFKPLNNAGEGSKSAADNIEQTKMLAGLVYGGVQNESWHGKVASVDFFDVKGDLEALLATGGAEAEYEFLPTEHPVLHPGQSAVVRRNGNDIGYIGALHPAIQNKLGISGQIYLFQVKLAELLTGKAPEFKELSKFPEVRRDLAVIVEEKISAQTILENVRQTAGEWLTSVVLFDVYQGTNVEEGHKSIAFGLTLQHPARTLKDDEVNEIVDNVVTSLKDKLNVILRE